MTAFNIVRLRVKPGREEAFIEAHPVSPGFKGFWRGALVKTGERAYCIVGVTDPISGDVVMDLKP